MLDFIRETWLQLVDAFVNFRIADLIDILLISYLIYKAIGFLRDSRGGQLVKGLLILVVVSILASILKLTTTQWLISSVIDSLVIALAIIFQPELRRMLERVGRTNFTHSQGGQEGDSVSTCIDAISKALVTLQEKKTGALIVFERTTQLGEIIDTGTIVDAAASVSIINNVFFPKSPLHDGAVIIREGRIYAAGCILPLTQREDLSLQLGTRHRAAIGMTENSDAVVLIVSEETGIISIAQNGQITRNYNPISAGAELKNLMIDQKGLEKQNSFSKILSVFKKKNVEKGEENND